MLVCGVVPVWVRGVIASVWVCCVVASVWVW